MPILSKIKRILYKTLVVGIIVFFLLCLTVFFAIKSYNFQTYLGKIATNYLSKELNNKINIKLIEIDLFKKLHLKNVLVLDQKKDTILYGNVTANIKLFDFQNKKIIIDNILLDNVNSKIISYKNSKDLNIDFLINYFSDDNTTKKNTHKPKWEVVLNEIELKNVNFTYRDEHKNTNVSENINYNNLVFKNTFGKLSNLKFDNDIIQTSISNFKTTEQCGFKLNKLNVTTKLSSIECLLTNLDLATDSSLIKGNIEFAYNEWKDFNEFVDKIKINSELKPGTKIYFKDIATFAEDLNGLNKTISLNGHVAGFISDLNLTHFKFNYGKNTQFDGDVTLTGLPVINTDRKSVV